MKRIFLFPTLLFPLFAMAVDHRMTLDELVVQGSALEETLPSELADYGAELEIIDSEQLEKSGTSDVGQALQGNVPGLFLSPKTGRGDYVDISIQGSRTEDVLWLVDGVRINNRLFGGTTPLDSISTPMIERIEVLEGRTGAVLRHPGRGGRGQHCPSPAHGRTLGHSYGGCRQSWGPPYCRSCQ
jgi:Outer membrane cobalamin receptor protein